MVEINESTENALKQTVECNYNKVRIWTQDQREYVNAKTYIFYSLFDSNNYHSLCNIFVLDLELN